MKLTDGERLIVVMLAEVMEALKLNREIDPSLIRTLVCNGDYWAIRRKYNGIFGDGPEDRDVKETTEILWTWGVIESSIAKLTGSQKEEANGWRCNKFGGFDANHDPHYGTAHTMINDLEEFVSFKGCALNSHYQSSLPRYLTMYTKFSEYIQSEKAAPLAFESLRDLCS